MMTFIGAVLIAIVANIFNFKDAEFFVADEKAKENIQVRF